MKRFMLSGNEYFDEMPQPVLLVHAHRLRYFNRAAERAFWPLTLEEEGPLPPALAQEADGVVTLGEQGWICRKRQLPEGALYVLRQAVDSGEECEVLLERLAGRNAAQLQQLSRAIHQLEGELVETERLRVEPQLAQLRKIYARMIRTDQNIGYFCQMAPGQVDENFPMRVLDIAGLCREAARQCEYLLETVGIALVYEDTGESILVRGNEALLFQLIYNLLSNSAKGYHGRAGVIFLRVESVGQSAMITVEDSGESIRPGVMETIFDLEKGVSCLRPFGLGLPLGRKIANYHGGGLFLLNKRPGSRAVLSLPTVQAKFRRQQEAGRVERLASLRMTWDTFHPALIGLSDVVPARVFEEAAAD